MGLWNTISNVYQNIQVEASSGSGGHTEAVSTENSNAKTEGTSLGDSNDKEMTLGDALSQIKDASPTSLEELQNLAGGADIKVKNVHMYFFRQKNFIKVRRIGYPAKKT